MSPETTGSSRGLGGCSGVRLVRWSEAQLIITAIHLRQTPAPFYDGASQRRRAFDESPFLDGESPADREASISPRAAIHHLIRTAGCCAWTAGLPESSEGWRVKKKGGGGGGIGEAAPAPSQANRCRVAVAVYKCFKLGIFFGVCVLEFFSFSKRG